MPLHIEGVLQQFRDTDRDTLEHADEEATEVARHHHSNECWWGAAAAASLPEHAADPIADQDTTTAFQISGGNMQWGAWVQILGTEDMPCESGHTVYDFHEVGITTVQRALSTHWMQFAFGSEPTDEAANGTYTNIFYHPAAANARAVSVPIQAKRHANATAVWARALVVGQNLGTIDFYFSTHGYVE